MYAPESRSEFHQFISNVLLKKDDRLSGDGHPLLDYALHLAFYAALTAIFLMIVALIVKLMFNCDEDEDEEGRREAARRATEHSRLFMPKESAADTTYGTSKDIETGSTSSSEDLYDGKICVICYDEKRNCFFVPCGHCIACYTCANRIVEEESRSCPICRGIIDKIRKLHIL